MRRIVPPGLAALASPLALAALCASAGCAVSSHPSHPSTLGTARPGADLLAVIDQPGPVTVETVASADWAVERSGLINLDHPAAKAAGLQDGDEAIQIYFHALRHPSRGLFLVDTGVERALRDARDKAAVRGLVTRFMHFEKMKFPAPLGDWLAAHPADPVRGVFLTHLHLDHVTGMADVPAGTPVYTGPGEAAASSIVHVFVRGSTDRTLEGKPPLEEWTFASPQAGGSGAGLDGIDGVVDVFGDGSVWALFVPGHTPGSTAYLARTPTGPVLLVGDTCHTRWGWEHDVEPGSFTADRAQNARSLAALRRLVAGHPTIRVRLGHQE